MTWLLRSPFSGIIDGAVMLLSIRGRRTGTVYTLPVEYAQHDRDIWVMAGDHDRKAWWRNLLDESPVRVRIRGQDLEATATSYKPGTAPAVVADGLRIYLRRFPAFGRRSGAVDRHGNIDDARLLELAASTVIVRFELATATSTSPDWPSRELSHPPIVGTTTEASAAKIGSGPA
jgi:deazaflavin-dependent oxidoreductase (nitroreductase family)